jgi:hypothetical protein
MYSFDLIDKYDCDDTYRSSLLGVFNLTEYSNDINFGIDFIYDKIKVEPTFNELMIKAANSILSEDPLVGLIILFSYDHFYDFHNCIIEYNDTQTASIEKIDKIKDKFIKK